MSGLLWVTGGFSLSDVLAGRADCPPLVRTVAAVAWRPPARPPLSPPASPPAPPADLPRPPVHDEGGLVLARRASDFARPRPEAAEEEATLRGAWEAALAVLQPVAAQRIGPLDLVFAGGEEAPAACRRLYEGLRLCRQRGDWRVGYARLRPLGFGAAVRALDLWVLDAGGDGSWLVDVTDLA